ncbi:MAG: membrane dipeptidase [Ferruginibacter sp.]
MIQLYVLPGKKNSINKKDLLIKISFVGSLLLIHLIAFCQFQKQKTLPAINKTIKPADSVKSMVAYIPAVKTIGSFKQFQFLKNGDFETGTNRSINGWNIDGKAFKLISGAYFQNTWEFMQVVPKASIGGDYWTDLTFNIGYKHQKWISSMGDGIIDNPNSAIGTFTSDPFRVYANNNFINFLISGGNDINTLKIELLEYVIRPRLTGNISNIGNNPAIPNLPGNNSRNNVGTRIDTLFVAIAGILPKTGHNNDILRREEWDVRRLDTAKTYVIRITDNAASFTNKWGHINIDDVRMADKSLLAYVAAKDSMRVQKIVIKDLANNRDQSIVADYYVPLFGAADTHTHLMSHLAMGNKLLHGAPDVGSLLPAGTLYKDAGFDIGETKADCNAGPVRAASVEEALGSCNATHGGWGTDNNCGNYLRAGILNSFFDSHYNMRVPMERNLHGDHPHEGYPNLIYWPNYSSASHQQMYVDWIRRAYEGGLRVMVTLTVNSELLGGILSGDAPLDDKSRADLQLDEIKNFVRRHNDFMELALDAEDMRRIVRSGKLAIIMGMEVDNFGNFNYSDVTTNKTTVKAEIVRLFNKGVRYIFPIHVVNNKLGGSAVYSMLFNFNNQYANSRPLAWGAPIPPGLMFKVDQSPDPRVNYNLRLADVPTFGSMNAAIFGAKAVFEGLSQIPFPPAFDVFKCPTPTLACLDQFKILKSLLIPDASWDIYQSTTGGMVNHQGLTPLGEFAITEMMRLGMIIDVDHMSEKSVAGTLALAGHNHYPVMSGHTGMRDGFHENPNPEINENQRSDEQLTLISNGGGMFGVGISELTAAGYLKNLRLALSKMGNRAVTMGSDINGFVTLSEPRFDPRLRFDPAKYGSSISRNWNLKVNYYNGHNPEGLKQYTFGSANRKWDYNTEGLVHIGLYPDFYQDLKNLGMTQSERQVFFSAADYFVNMWEICEKNKTGVEL